ncbi:unnamed protein product [Vicia faba]|uniref:RING-type domain-containing protein n=1 Tax=Vicia faba TaxID=3906 RepID=A0AAV1A0F9_VICFA|nr:unnamed protein product [Vicia faba]
MNCLVICQSRWWIVTIVLYTCVFIPLKQLKRSLANMFGQTLLFLFSCESKEIEFPAPSLPVAWFEDLKGDGDEEEICSICLVEFEGEDAVSKLRRCKHVFHFNCIEQWLERSQFSCPLCRSFLFS